MSFLFRGVLAAALAFAVPCPALGQTGSVALQARQMAVSAQRAAQSAQAAAKAAQDAAAAATTSASAAGQTAQAALTTAASKVTSINGQSGAVTLPVPTSPDLTLYAKKTDLPAGATVAPSMETVGGSAGSSTAYMRADARLPRITRAGMTTTDSAGAWTISWSTSLAAAPATLPIPMIPIGGTQPIVCLPAASTATSASGRCWYARTLPGTIVTVASLVSFDVFGAPASNITVQVFAIPTTQ